MSDQKETKRSNKPMTSRDKKNLKKKSKYEKESELVRLRYVDDQASGVKVSQVDVSSAQRSRMDQESNITVEGITIKTDDKQGFLLNNADLRLVANRRYGLVGRNGLGKSTLLRHMADRTFRIPESTDMLLCEQEIRVDATPAFEYLLKSDTRRNDLLGEIEALENQLDEASDDVLSRLNELYEEMELIGCDSAEARARKILSGLGFSHEMQNQATEEFSGGWRMRLSLARALFIEPTLLLLDEPTNHLDMNAILWLSRYLEKWKKTLLVVSHDQSFLDYVCTDIIHLDNKKLVNYKGDFTRFKKVFEQKKREQNRTGKKEEEETDVHFEFHPTLTLAHPLFHSGIGCADPYLVHLKGVGFGFPGRDSILQGIDFGVGINSRVAIVGPNGHGKSTVLKLLSGDLEPCAGDRFLENEVLVHRLDQHSGSMLDPDSSPLQFLTDRYQGSSRESVSGVLGECGLESHVCTRRNSTLSGGQQAKVGLAEISLLRPDVLLLDEPTNNLDYESIDALVDAINGYGGGVVLVSHDENLIRETNCEVWTIDHQGLSRVEGGFDKFKDRILKSLK